MARNWQARHRFSLVKIVPVPHADGSQKRSSSEPYAGVDHVQVMCRSHILPRNKYWSLLIQILASMPRISILLPSAKSLLSWRLVAKAPSSSSSTSSVALVTV